MAEATSTGAAKAAPKRKSTARKRPATKTTTARSTARKTAARKTTARKSTPRRKAAASSDAFATRAREAGRKAFLASLGFYGKAYDQVQEQFSSVQDQLEARRKKADKLYAELVKRGEKVEKQARSALDDMELPKLDGLADRKELEARLDRARERFSELKGTVGFKTAA